MTGLVVDTMWWTSSIISFQVYEYCYISKTKQHSAKKWIEPGSLKWIEAVPNNWVKIAVKFVSSYTELGIDFSTGSKQNKSKKNSRSKRLFLSCRLDYWSWIIQRGLHGFTRRSGVTVRDLWQNRNFLGNRERLNWS